jgi:hypothetical protein
MARERTVGTVAQMGAERRTAHCDVRRSRAAVGPGPFRTRRWRYNETRDRGDSELRAGRSREEVCGDVGCRSCRWGFRALVDGRIDCRRFDGMFEGRTGVQCKGSTGGTFDGVTDSQRICNRRGAASPEAAPLVFSVCSLIPSHPQGTSPRKEWPQFEGRSERSSRCAQKFFPARHPNLRDPNSRIVSGRPRLGPWPSGPRIT